MGKGTTLLTILTRNQRVDLQSLVLWCLKFQLYRGGQWRIPEYSEKTNNLSQITDKLLLHNVAQVVVIGIVPCKVVMSLDMKCALYLNSIIGCSSYKLDRTG